MLDMEEQKPDFKFHKCKEDDMWAEKLLLKKLAKMGEIEWR